MNSNSDCEHGQWRRRTETETIVVDGGYEVEHEYEETYWESWLRSIDDLGSVDRCAKCGKVVYD